MIDLINFMFIEGKQKREMGYKDDDDDDDEEDDDEGKKRTWFLL